MTETIYDQWGRAFVLPGLYDDFPNFFRLIHLNRLDAEVARLDIAEPDGWSNLRMKLVRDPDWHGVNYEYSSSAAACEFDGYSGRDFVESIFRAEGEDAVILLQFGIHAPNMEVIEFESRLDLSTRRTTQRRTSCALERKNLHSKVLARWETSVDLGYSRSLDGVELTPPTFINIPLTSQSLDERYQCNVSAGKRIEQTFQGDTNGHIWVYFDLSQPQVDQITESSKGISGLSDSDGPILNDEWAFKFRSSGVRKVSIELNYKLELVPKKRTISIGAAYVMGFSATTLLVHVAADGTRTDYPITTPIVYGSRLNPPQGFREPLVIIYPNGKLEVNIDTKQNDKLYLFGLFSFDHNKNELQQTQTAFTILTQRISITGQSENRATSARALPIGDALNSALALATGLPDRFRSNFYGLMSARYPTDGCGARRVVLNGFAIRQFKASERPLSISMQDALVSLREIDCIGLTYGSELDNNNNPVDIMKVEPIQAFYRPVELLRLDEVSDYHEESIGSELYTTVEIGYQDYLTDGVGALEEVFTTHQVTTPIRNATDQVVKKTITSKFIASSLAIERTRREQFADTPADGTTYDEKGFLICCKPIEGYVGSVQFGTGLAASILITDQPITWLTAGAKIILTGSNLNSGTYTVTFVSEATKTPWSFYVKENVVTENANGVSIQLQGSVALQPETGADFEKVTGLLAPDGTYNLRITPARNLIQTIPVWGGCLLNKDKYALINKVTVTETGLLPVSFNDNLGYSTITPDHYIDWLTVGMKINISGNGGNTGLFTVIYVAEATRLPWIFFVQEPVTTGSGTLVNISFESISGDDLAVAANKTRIPNNKKVTTQLLDTDTCGKLGIVKESAPLPVDEIIPKLIYLPRKITFSVRLSRQEVQRLRLGHTGLLPIELDDNGNPINRNYGYVSLLDERGIRVGGYLSNVEYGRDDEKAVFELRALALDLGDTTQGLDCSQFAGWTWTQAENADARTRRRIELCRYLDVDPL